MAPLQSMAGYLHRSKMGVRHLLLGLAGVRVCWLRAPRQTPHLSHHMGIHRLDPLFSDLCSLLLYKIDFLDKRYCTSDD